MESEERCFYNTENLKNEINNIKLKIQLLETKHDENKIRLDHITNSHEERIDELNIILNKIVKSIERVQYILLGGTIGVLINSFGVLEIIKSLLFK